MNERRNKINKDLFQNYLHNEHVKKVNIYKCIIISLLLANIICIAFIFVLKSQTNHTKYNNTLISNQIFKNKVSYNKLKEITDKRLVNFFSNNKVHSYSFIETIDTSYELDKILEWTGFLKENFVLCYKGTNDNHNPLIFQKYCNKDILIFIIKIDNGMRFGGIIHNVHMPLHDDVYIKDDNAMLFSLDLMKTYNVIDGTKAMKVRCDGFVEFGDGDIHISDAYIKGGSFSNFPSNYGNTEEDSLLDLTGGVSNLGIVEIEIFGSDIMY